MTDRSLHDSDSEHVSKFTWCTYSGQSRPVVDYQIEGCVCQFLH